MDLKTPRIDLEWAGNTNYTGTATGEYDGDATKVDAGTGIRANGLVPEEPIPVEYVNHEISEGHKNTLSLIQRSWFGLERLAANTDLPYHFVPIQSEHTLQIGKASAGAYSKWCPNLISKDSYADVDEVLAATSNGAQIVFFGTGAAYAEGSGFSLSTDKGVTFDFQVNPWAGDTMTRAMLHDPVNGRFFAFGLSSGNHGALTSPTGAVTTWTARTTGSTNIHGHAAVDPNSGVVVAMTRTDATTLEWVATSDGGATWTDDTITVPTTSHVLGLAFDDQNQLFVLTTQNDATDQTRVYTGEYESGSMTWTLNSTLSNLEATLTALHAASAITQGLLLQCFKGLWIVSSQRTDQDDNAVLMVTQDQGANWATLNYGEAIGDHLASIYISHGALYMNLSAKWQGRSKIPLT